MNIKRAVAFCAAAACLLALFGCTAKPQTAGDPEDKPKLTELSDEELLAVFEEYGVGLDDRASAESLRESLARYEEDPNYKQVADWSFIVYRDLDIKYVYERYNGIIDGSLPTPISHMGKEGCRAKLTELGVEFPESVKEKSGAYVNDFRKWVISLEENIDAENPCEEEFAPVFEAVREAVRAYMGK